MADVPNNAIKIQTEEVSSDSPATSSTMYKVGGAINYLIDVGLNTQTFDVPGSYSWTSPPVITRVHVQMIGGGGGGCKGGVSGSPPAAAPGGGGGGGGGIFQGFVTVVPNTVYTINVGAGGAGGVLPTLVGDNGSGTNAFGITVEGGTGGNSAGGSGANNGFGYRTSGGPGGGSNGAPGLAGESNAYSVGGPGNAAPGPTFTGGGGGGAGFDAGGSIQTNLFGTRGSGGGGTQGTDVGATPNAGPGGDGVVILTWFGNP